MRLKLLMIPALAVATLAGACAENVPEIFIVANQIYTDECEPPTAGAGATNQAFRTRGVVDLFVTDRYQMVPRIENTLVPSNSVFFGRRGAAGGLTGTDWEANLISLKRAVIRFDVPDALGVPLPRQLEVDLSGSVQPGGAASVELQVIPPSIGANLATAPLLRQARTSVTINLRVQFFGETSGKREVGSNEFVYPIELCYGCLLSIPPDAIDRDFAIQPNCRNEEFAEGVDPTDECFAGQDSPIDCRFICPIVTSVPNGDPEGICEPNLDF